MESILHSIDRAQLALMFYAACGKSRLCCWRGESRDERGNTGTNGAAGRSAPGIHVHRANYGMQGWSNPAKGCHTPSRPPYDHYLRHSNHVQRTIGYIEQNPVSAGLVCSAECWRLSSAGWQAKPPGETACPTKSAGSPNQNVETPGGGRGPPRRPGVCPTKIFLHSRESGAHVGLSPFC